MENVLNNITEILKYSFLQKALISGIFISMACSLLGVFLVLKKYSFIGDGLAHVTLFSIALAVFLGYSPFYFSIPIIVTASLLMMNLNSKINIHTDSSIAMISSASIALAITIISLAKGVNVDLFGYMFGSILTTTTNDVILSTILAIIVLIFVLFFYNELFLMTFDNDLAKVSSVKVKKLNYILSFITAITIIVGIKIVGTMLISSLIIFPAITALQISKNFKSTVLNSVLIGVSALVIGIFTSIIFSIPTGGAIVIINGIIFIISLILKKI